MAEGVKYVCGGCHKAIEAWSDGNPYYFDDDGIKRYAYHPDHERLDRCIGNDSPHICLSCGTEFMVDSLAPETSCPKCGAGDFAVTFHLGGQRCPFCKSGVFAPDPNSYCIS